MRLFLLPAILLIIVNLLIDGYILSVLRRLRSRLPSKIHIAAAAVMLVAIIVALCLPRRSGSEDLLRASMWIFYAYLSVYIPKLLFTAIDLAGRIPSFFKRPRWKAFRVAGVIVAVTTFIIMWWGALIGRYNIDVRDVTVYIDDLPESFEGYRIVQFSDAHVGTYGDDTSFTTKIADKIASLDADAVVFTGDIVNMRSEELIPHVSVLSDIKSRDGVYSVLGNHDYGDYSDWPSKQAKDADVANLVALQRSMGWRMLNDDHVWLRRANDSIALIGVENIGDAPFPTYGSLRRAYKDISDSNVKILLSHNPMHWVDSISTDKRAAVDLTLSGHTHAMQFELFGWSPAKFRYPTWGGLYKSDTNQQLYVNIGTGTVGFPARIGANPEITVITLKRSK